MLMGALRFRSLKIPPWLVPALGYLVSAASLVWVFRGVDLSAILSDFAALDWRWVTLAVAADISVYLWQAWRWNLLLSPVARPSLWRSVLAIYVGLFANEVLPLRPGEFVIRPYLQARWSKLPFSVALSSILIERVFDGLWLGAAFWVTTMFMPLPTFLVDGGRILGVVVVWLAAMLALIMFRKHHAQAAVKQTRWSGQLRVLVDDLHLMGRSRSFYLALLISLPYLLFQIVPIYALMQGYGLDLSIWPATVMLIILRLGTIIPQAPGNVGAFQVLTVLVLGLFGIDKTTAAGFSVMTWAVVTLPLLAAGFLALAITGTRLGALRRQAYAPASAAPAEARSQ
jgi:uncharacterized protein (TIRG00374 family)